MGSLWRRRRARREDEGFSLVETVVAMTIAGFAFSTLSLALISGVHASTLAQQNQQAGDLLTQTVERARVLSYAALSMRPTDLDAGETGRSPSISSCQCYNPADDSTSGTGVEPLAPTDPNGGISPHLSTATQNGLTFTVRQYVTAPADATGAGYKRLTVLVTWTSLGKSHERHYSTVIASTRRGLPLPDYKFTANGGGLSQCRNPGSQVVYGFTLKNNGARDAWSLSNTGDGSWTWYLDVDGDGTLGSSDTNLGGSPSTGLIEPTAQVKLLAVADVPVAAVTPAPYTWTTTLRATSVAQSTFFSDLTAVTEVVADACGGTASPTPSPTTSASASPSPTAGAQPAVCPAATATSAGSAPSGTVVRYYLNNPSYPGDTPASYDLPMSRDGGAPPAGSQLYAYSSNVTANVGRYLAAGTASTLTDKASWLYQMPATSVLKGSGAITLWAMADSGSSATVPDFTVTLEHLSSTGTLLTTLVPTVAVNLAGTDWASCNGMRSFSVSFAMPNGSGTTINANEKLLLTVAVTNSVAVRLAYDTSTFPSELQLPYKSGLG